MNEDREIVAVIREGAGYNAYDALLDALEKRRAAVNLSGLHLDAIAGMAEGLYSKIMAQKKGLGPKTLGPILGTLGIGIMFFVDEEAMERVQKRLEASQRNENQARLLTNASMRVPRWLFSPRTGRKAGKRSARSMTAKQRHLRAKRAARARWGKDRATRQAGRCAPLTSDTKPKPVKASATHPRAVQYL